MIKQGDSLKAMQSDLDLSGWISLTYNHLRARARKFSGSIAMSDLWGKVNGIGEKFAGGSYLDQQYWVDRAANIYNGYNPAATLDWSFYLRFKGAGAKDGLEFGTLKEDFGISGDIGYGSGMFNVAEPGNYRLRFSLLQTNTPGATRAGVVEVVGCTNGYIAGDVEYLYRETTRLSNPLVVDTTITVSSSHPYVCPTFLAITKGSAPGFTGCDCELAYMEITKI